VADTARPIHHSARAVSGIRQPPDLIVTVTVTDAPRLPGKPPPAVHVQSLIQRADGACTAPASRHGRNVLLRGPLHDQRGATPNLDWSGTIYAGLSINSEEQVSGTPTTAGSIRSRSRDR